MNTKGWIIAGTVMAGALMSVASAAQPAAGRPPLAPRHATANGPPVVVELFTAQGCGGCIEECLRVGRRTRFGSSARQVWMLDTPRSSP